jgi:hypothetical protein
MSVADLLLFGAYAELPLSADTFKLGNAVKRIETPITVELE